MTKRAFDLAALLSNAKLAQPHVAHVPAGLTEATAFIPKPAAVSAILGLGADHLPALIGKDGTIVRVPFAAPGGQTLPLDAAIARASRVAQAGTVIIVRGEPDSANATGRTGEIIVQRIPGAFDVIEPAGFSAVADDTDVAVSPAPISSAAIDFSGVASRAVRIEVPRSMQRNVDRELLGAELLTAVVLGVARAADAILLEALAGAALADFSLAAAATAGVRFDELRALIGTTGTGATVDAGGSLRAAGIPAELTADAAGSFIGAFDRAAVAIHADMPLHVERRDAAGNLAVTCFLTAQALLPAPGFFWAVGA
ncbi:hypothetical protein [Fulvimonas yonginensis]|uniref:Phage major capsid protein n=1 Tax=Fulvimonas yonginensis TaxID=1495200 RepID=A0ABU8JFD0_9GAMM